MCCKYGKKGVEFKYQNVYDLYIIYLYLFIYLYIIYLLFRSCPKYVQFHDSMRLMQIVRIEVVLCAQIELLFCHVACQFENAAAK